MILQVLSVRDRAADVFDRPSFHVAIGAAQRAFGDEINRSESPFNAHPEDFDLYHLGVYDDSNASFILLDEPRQISVGKDLVRV